MCSNTSSEILQCYFKIMPNSLGADMWNSGVVRWTYPHRHKALLFYFM